MESAMTESYVVLNANRAEATDEPRAVDGEPTLLAVQPDMYQAWLTRVLNDEVSADEPFDSEATTGVDEPSDSADEPSADEVITGADEPSDNKATADEAILLVDEPRRDVDAATFLADELHRRTEIDEQDADEPPDSEAMATLTQSHAMLAQCHAMLTQCQEQLNVRDAQIAKGARILAGYQDQLQTATDQLQTATDQLKGYQTWLNRIPSKTQLEVIAAVLGGVGGIDAGHGARLWLGQGASLAGGWHIFVGALTLASAVLIWKFVMGMPGPAPPLPAT